MFRKLLARVPFWLPITALCFFGGFNATSWGLQLIFGCLTTAAISGLVSAHLSEWKADNFRMF